MSAEQHRRRCPSGRGSWARRPLAACGAAALSLLLLSPTNAAARQADPPVPDIVDDSDLPGPQPDIVDDSDLPRPAPASDVVVLDTEAAAQTLTAPTPARATPASTTGAPAPATPDPAPPVPTATAGPGQPDELPRTGASDLVLTVVGLALLLGGFGLLAEARRYEG